MDHSYLRYLDDISESKKIPPPSYYSNHSMHFKSNQAKPQIEQGQKYQYFANTRKDSKVPSKSGYTSRNQEPRIPGPQINIEKGIDTSYLPSDRRSISRSKSRERLQSYSTIHQSRSTASLLRDSKLGIYNTLNPYKNEEATERYGESNINTKRNNYLRESRSNSQSQLREEYLLRNEYTRDNSNSRNIHIPPTLTNQESSFEYRNFVNHDKYQQKQINNSSLEYRRQGKSDNSDFNFESPIPTNRQNKNDSIEEDSKNSFEKYSVARNLKFLNTNDTKVSDRYTYREEKPIPQSNSKGFLSGSSSLSNLNVKQSISSGLKKNGILQSLSIKNQTEMFEPEHTLISTNKSKSGNEREVRSSEYPRQTGSTLHFDSDQQMNSKNENYGIEISNFGNILNGLAEIEERQEENLASTRTYTGISNMVASNTDRNSLFNKIQSKTERGEITYDRMISKDPKYTNHQRNGSQINNQNFKKPVNPPSHSSKNSISDKSNLDLKINNQKKPEVEKSRSGSTLNLKNPSRKVENFAKNSKKVEVPINGKVITFGKIKSEDIKAVPNEKSKPRFLNPNKVSQNFKNDNYNSADYNQNFDMSSPYELEKLTLSDPFQSATSRPSLVKNNSPERIPKYENLTERRYSNYESNPSYKSERSPSKIPSAKDILEAYRDTPKQTLNTNFESLNSFEPQTFKDLLLNGRNPVWDLPPRNDALPKPPESDIKEKTQSKMLELLSSEKKNSNDWVEKSLLEFERSQSVPKSRESSDKKAASSRDSLMKISLQKSKSKQEEKTSSLNMEENFLLNSVDRSNKKSNNPNQISEIENFISPKKLSFGIKFSYVSTLKGHKNTVTCISKDLDKNVIWSGSKDKTIMNWTLHDFLKSFEIESKEKKIQENHGTVLFNTRDSIDCLLCDRDKRLIFSGGGDSVIRAWNSLSKETVNYYKGHKGGVFCLEELEDTSFLSASGDGIIKSWDMMTGINTTSWNAHKNRIYSIAVFQDGVSKTIISASADREIKIWDHRSPKFIHSFNQHEADVTSLTLINGKFEFASASQDSTVKIWDLRTRKLIKSYDLGSSIYALGYYQKGNKLIAGGDSLMHLDLGEDDSVFEINDSDNQHSGSIRSLLIDKEQNVLYTASFDKTIKVWFIKKD